MELNNIKNKGKFLEEIIDITNQKYWDNNELIVTKIPVPINIIEINKKIITKGNFTTNKNCDYVGCLNGTYFEFEAKETSKDFFNWNNITKNQQKKLDLVSSTNGLSFLIIYFHKYETFFIVNYLSIKRYVFENYQKIPYKWFESNHLQLTINESLVLDYKEQLYKLAFYN